MTYIATLRLELESNSNTTNTDAAGLDPQLKHTKNQLSKFLSNSVVSELIFSLGDILIWSSSTLSLSSPTAIAKAIAADDRDLSHGVRRAA